MGRFYNSLRNTPDGRGIGCAGIDPSESILAHWRLPYSSEGALRFGSAIIEAAAQSIQVIKPQVAYFEQFGAAGYAALAQIIEEARNLGLLVIVDAKRGDIGSTSDAYGRAWFGDAAPMQAELVTLAGRSGQWIGRGESRTRLQGVVT